MGVSMSGKIAHEIAINYPDRVVELLRYYLNLISQQPDKFLSAQSSISN